MGNGKERKLFKEGAAALRSVFGKRAEAVAYFLAHMPVRRAGGPSPEDVEDVFKKTLSGRRARKSPVRGK
jgi:hypothetical protein